MIASLISPQYPSEEVIPESVLEQREVVVDQLHPYLALQSA